MNIKFVDLVRQLYGDPVVGNSGIINEIEEVMGNCAKNASFTEGKYLENFENEFAEFCDAPFCVGLNSGTDALEFALKARGINSGNIITVPNSYFTTASSISAVGATPRFVDIDSKTFNMDVTQLEGAIDENTKAILPVHLYGRPAQMDKIIRIAKKYKLEVIEDCCQAHGAVFDGKKVPISGIGAFSFFPGKNLGAWGDGGALIVEKENLARQTKMLRNDGVVDKYVHNIIGRKSRLHALQAAILSVKLKHLEEWNAKRLRLAKMYNNLLEDVKEIQLPLLGDDKIKPVFHIYPILTKDRKRLSKFLNKNGIETNIHYPIPIHIQEPYQNLGLKEGSFPVAERIANEVLSLPIFPEMRDDELIYVCEKIKEYFS